MKLLGGKKGDCGGDRNILSVHETENFWASQWSHKSTSIWPTIKNKQMEPANVHERQSGLK